MFGISVKVWKMGDEEEEFSLIITHIPSVQKFLLLYLNQLETEFLVSKETVESISAYIHPLLLEKSTYYEETWSSEATVQKTQEKTLGNIAECEKDTLEEDFNKVVECIKEEEEHKNSLYLPSWNDLENYPIDFQDNITTAMDELMDTEVFDDDIFNPTTTLKSNCRNKTSTANSLKCVVNSCALGNLAFKTLKELKRHQKDSHANLFCTTCNIVSNSEEDLATHSCTKRFKCKLCQRLFSTNHELKSHSYIHSGEKPHMCDFCGKEFRQRATLDRHKLTHESARNYDCDICHKKFKFKHYLVSHKLLHSGVKPHMCTWCGMRFAQNANMQKHIRQQHTNEKYYVCKYCGKGFVQPYYLRRHMTCHKEAVNEKASLDMLVESHTSSDEQTGIRTYSCIYCSVTCKGQRELQIHISKHHQDLLNGADFDVGGDTDVMKSKIKKESHTSLDVQNGIKAGQQGPFTEDDAGGDGEIKPITNELMS